MQNIGLAEKIFFIADLTSSNNCLILGVWEKYWTRRNKVNKKDIAWDKYFSHWFTTPPDTKKNKSRKFKKQLEKS